MKKWKRTLAAALSLAMIAGSSLPAHAQGNEESGNSLLASYPLLGDVNDVSGNGNHGKAEGDVRFDAAEGMTLPGGNNSNTNYVRLPGAMFENQENLTISTWIKSNTDKGNYSALFFGSKAQANGMPASYWLLNPTNLSGNFKSVFTNSVNEGAPYNTEVGLGSPSTVGYKGVWTHYTTVITENSITGYINGQKIDTADKSRKVSDFGAGLEAYIGRSNYLGDHTYAGTFQDVRVYKEALDDQEVADVFSEALTDSTKNVVLEKAKEQLSIGSISNVVANLNLPNTGAYNTTIRWESSNPDAVTAEGKVTLKEQEQDAVLTATIQLGEASVTKEFNVHIAKGDSALMIIADKLNIPSVITEDTELPKTLDGAAITWESGNKAIIADNGSITAPEEGISEAVALKASLEKDGKSLEKNFSVKVMEKNPAYVTAYTRKGVSNLTSAMHLGYSEDGTAYEALHYNTGILFPKADLNEGQIYGTTKLLVNPYIFRMEDGSFGVVATRTDKTSDGDAAARSSVLLFTSQDLITYEEKGLLNVGGGKEVNKPVCEFDSSVGKYRITWEDENGDAYYNLTADLVSAEEAVAAERALPAKTESGIKDAEDGYAIPVTKAEGKKLSDKFLPVTNTEVSSKEVSTTIGTELDEGDLGNVTASYSDGSTTEMPVNWSAEDLKKVDFEKKGTYKVGGTVKQTEYNFPMIEKSADPNVLRYNGEYYFIATDEDGQDELYIRRAGSIKELADAKANNIFKANASGEMSGCIWAPELHEIGGELYILFAAGKPSWNTVQCHVMKLKSGGDPTVKEDWEAPARVKKADGSNLYDGGITLDMTYFEDSGRHYVVWSQRVIGSPNGSAELFIATIDPGNPAIVTSEPVMICTPDYSWDRNTTEVDEGPYVLKNDGKIYLTFSGSNIDQTYSIGLLTASAGADLTDPASWAKTNYPLVTSANVKGEYGPGHNSYTVDEDGIPVNIYHARTTDNTGTGPARHMGARRVHFAVDGTPILDMTDDREILKKNRTVTATIKVEEKTAVSPELQEAMDAVEIKDADNIRGNITLPEKGANGVVFTWESGNKKVISTEPKTNDGYFDMPGGIVTRPEQDTKVNLKVTGELDGETASKTIKVTVKKKASKKKYAGYLYAYFSGDESRMDDQQIYFSVSKDGLKWDDLNENNPVLTSTLGDMSVRDPYIIRSAEGDKFYLIATDLDIRADKYGGNWGLMATQGSRSLMIWESTDLVNWSQQRMVEVGGEIEAGNTWAPEAIYDEATGEYLVYWSSRVAGDEYAKHRIYVSKTRDFYSFTTPEVYSDEPNGNIDASILKIGESYYRLIKDDTNLYVKLEKADTLLNYNDEANRGSHFAHIPNAELEGFKGGYEGATMFKFIGENKWCTLVDEYVGARRGYIPFISTDPAAENSFSLMADGTYLMPTGAKHGTVIPITQEEYDALTEKWAVKAPKEKEQKEPILAYDFEQSQTGTRIEDVTGNGNDGALSGNAQYVNDAEKGNVLYLDGSDNTYAKLPDGLFDGRNKVTISMDVKSEMTSDNFFTFAIGQDNQKYMFLRTRSGQLRNAITTQSYSKEREVATSGSYLNQWVNIAIVMDGHTMSLYQDGRLAGRNEYVRSIGDLGSNLLSYLGKAFYNDPYFKGSFDNVKVYNRALDADEIAGSQTEDDGMILNYDFMDVAGSTVKDISGKGNDGTIKGDGATVQDGVLTLPGGAAGSKAAYVQMPTGMFDGQDTLTISAWLKNETGRDNYSAIFFGTTESLPTGYWLLNPCNKSGKMKSVITNSKSANAPYNTEVGFSPTLASMGIDGPETDNQWGMYTTVIEPDKITAYYNGKKLGSVKTNRKVSDFGEDLVAYIGRSSYNDRFYEGSVKDVKVYTRAVSDYEVVEEYYRGLGDEEAIQNVLNEDAELLILPYDRVTGNIEFPTEGKNGSRITWASSDSAHLTKLGVVKRPKAGEGNAEVTLTATIQIAGQSVTKDFSITVLEDTPANDLEIMMRDFNLKESYVTEDMDLPKELGEGAAIKWTSSDPDVLGPDGKVTRPEAGTGNQEVTLTGQVTYKEETSQKEFKVTVIEKDYAYLLSYVKEGDTDRTDALHIGYSEDGEKYQALNNNKPILYTTKGEKKMGAPVIFRKVDGTYGLIATDNQNSSSVILYDSEDLTTFTNEKYVSLNEEGIKVSNAECAYDYQEHAYRISWTGGNGKSYTMLTEDFITFSEKEVTDYKKAKVEGTLPAKAQEASVMGLTKEESQRIRDKYSRLTNTGVSDFADIIVDKGTDLSQITLPDTLTAKYSDGTSKNFGVEWNEESLNSVDTNTAGTYQVGGNAVYTEYEEVLVEERADPYVIEGEDGYYYFTASYPVRGVNDKEGYDRIILRRSETLNGLAQASEITIWDEKDSKKAHPYIWAPELHNINGTWYVLFTASRGGSVWDIRPHMLKCVNNADIMNPDSWKTEDESNLQEVKTLDGSSFADFSLDMTYFESNGTHYVAWAEKPGGISNIYLATINPDEPWKLTSNPMLLTTPDYAWEWEGGTIINEGPAVLKHDGKIFLCFSAAAVDDTYCVGMVSAAEGADLMDKSSWTKHPYPLLTSDDFADQYGPGHNSFTVDENGNSVIVYHARPRKCDSAEGGCGFVNGNKNNALQDPCRHARIKTLNFAADGTPVLNMNPEEELLKEYRAVTVNIIVTESAEEYADITYTAGEGGHIEGQAQQRVLIGNDASMVTAVADSGYKFVQWSDGVTEASRTDKEVQAGFTVEAQFEVTGTAPSEVDRSKLEELLVAAGKALGKESDYTKESYQNFKSVYETAMAVYQNPDATQDEINTQERLLKEAMASLVKVGNGGIVSPGGDPSGSNPAGNGILQWIAKTGDHANILLWIVLIAIAAAVVAVSVVRRKRK